MPRRLPPLALAMTFLALSLTMAAAHPGGAPGHRHGGGSSGAGLPVLTPVPEDVAVSGPDIGAVLGPMRVVGLHPRQQLNVRIGPGTEYPAIDALAPRERNLMLEICVPTRRLGWRTGLPHAVRRQITAMPTWCLVSQHGALIGWVNARYLGRD